MKLSELGSQLLQLLLLLQLPLTGGNPDAKRLYDDLLSNYNRLIRPVANNTDKITVKMGLKLSQLVDLVGGSKPSLLLSSQNCIYRFGVSEILVLM